MQEVETSVLKEGTIKIKIITVAFNRIDSQMRIGVP
jgi:hypothetical protein